MSSPTVADLYDAYEIISQKDKSEEDKLLAYKKIMLAVSGSESEKRLSSQFIVNFFPQFPELQEEAFNKLLDLGEEESIAIRKQVIQLFPTIAKKVPEYLPKVADTLIQMLHTEYPTEVAAINSSLDIIMHTDTKLCIEAIFNQLVTQLEETSDLINTNGFKYLSDTFNSMSDIKSEIEEIVENYSAKLLPKLDNTEEFSLIINILSRLKANSTVVGRQKLISQLILKARGLGDVINFEKFSIILQYSRQATKLMSVNVQADDLAICMIENLENVSKINFTDSKYKFIDYVISLVDLVNRGKSEEANTQVSKMDLSGENSLKHLKFLFSIFIDKLPEVPEEITDETISKLSEQLDWITEVEAILLAVHFLCKHRPESIVLDDKSKTKLQYLARIIQHANKTATESVSKLTKAQKSLDEFREVTRLPKITSNLQVLIRELFKSPPSFNATLQPSWVVVITPSADTDNQKKNAKKRLSGGNFGGSNKKYSNFGGGNRGRYPQQQGYRGRRY